MADLLTTDESTALAEHEATIERGLQTFVDVGNALLAIRDGKLYRAEYPTFEEYCQARWGFSDRRARQIMASAEVAGTIVPTGLPAPTNEGQARELGRIPEDQRADVWRETHERTGGKPTAAAIRDTWQPPAPESRPTPDPYLGIGEFWDDPGDEPDKEPDLPYGQERADAATVDADHQAAAKPAPVMLTLRTHKGDEVAYPKPKAKATFNETTGEGISWAAWSWNPVTGCLHGCKYCYARAIIHRYPDANPAGFTPLFHEQRIDAPSNTVIPERRRDDPAYRRVFVCSMADLYGRWVPEEWISKVHSSMLAAPEWEYLLLTKFPDRYVGLDMPPGAWVGTSVDEQKRVRIAERAFRQIEGAKVRWLSLEPLTEPLEFEDLSMFDWVVIGAQTATHQPDGPVEAFAPPFDWVARIVAQARAAGCKVHLKPNLVNGRPGMQLPNEYPEV